MAWLAFQKIRLLSYLGKIGGVAWSSGQRRSLSLLGSAVRIPVVPFFCLKKNHKSTKCEPARRERTKRPRRSGEEGETAGFRIRNEEYGTKKDGSEKI